MLRTGTSVSIGEGRRMFGAVNVHSSDNDLKVALNTCKLTSTNNAEDPKSHVILKNGYEYL